MRVVFAGTPEVALPALDALAASAHEVVGVITRPDAPTGRGKKLMPSPVANRAAELGIEIIRDAPRDPVFSERLRALAPDCVPIVAYGALIPQPVIDVPRHGWVNLHFSLLPRWRGAAPVQHAILAGDAETGATTFALVRELDAGPVYRTLRTPIGADENAGELLDRLALTGAELMLQTLDDIAAGGQPTPQPSAGATRAPKITADDARIDWAADDGQIDRLIRGCGPKPGAWTTLGGDRFKIVAARPHGGTPLPPGELYFDRARVLAGTGTRPVELVTVQPPGKRAMPAADWARGAALGPGARFDQARGTARLDQARGTARLDV